MRKPPPEQEIRRSISRPTIVPISVRVPEALAMTGLSRSRLYELIKSGEIEIVKVGASTLVLVESLKDAIERRRANSLSPTIE
jgi:excisionase family DNA binding protein